MSIEIERRQEELNRRVFKLGTEARLQIFENRKKFQTFWGYAILFGSLAITMGLGLLLGASVIAPFLALGVSLGIRHFTSDLITKKAQDIMEKEIEEKEEQLKKQTQYGSRKETEQSKTKKEEEQSKNKKGQAIKMSLPIDQLLSENSKGNTKDL